MAADEEMLKFDKPVLRIYSFKPSCLTIGYFMNALECVDFDFLKQNNIDLTRRITGGKGVLHHNEITYCVAAPISLFNNSVISAYEKTSKALKRAFGFCGIEVDNHSCEDKNHTPVCFAGKSRYEITYKSKKITGFAQKKCGDKVLQHCSIPFDIDFKLLSRCFLDNFYNTNELKSKMASFNDFIIEKENYDSFSEKLIKGFKEEFNIDFINHSFSPVHETSISKQKQKKYVMPCWIKKR